MKLLLGAALISAALIAPVRAMDQGSTESIVRSIPDRVRGLRLESLQRSEGTIQAQFRDLSPTTPAADAVAQPIPGVRVTTIEAGTDESATLEARRLVEWTSVAASRMEWKGLTLSVWSRDLVPGLPVPPSMLEGDGPEISRVTTRVGTTVVDVHAHPPLSKFVLPILGDLMQQLRQ